MRGRLLALALVVGIAFTAPSDGTAAASAAPSSKTGGARSVLARIAACESGGDPTAVSADGTYRGKYQFDAQTWASVGGTGDPALAGEAEQDRRAALLHRARGTQPWPECGSEAP